MRALQRPTRRAAARFHLTLLRTACRCFSRSFWPNLRMLISPQTCLFFAPPLLAPNVVSVRASLNETCQPQIAATKKALKKFRSMDASSLKASNQPMSIISLLASLRSGCELCLRSRFCKSGRLFKMLLLSVGSKIGSPPSFSSH